MEIVHVYQKQRKEFGRVPQFELSEISVIVDLPPQSKKKRDYIVRNPCSVETQCYPNLSVHSTNTETTSVLDKGQNHLEGGWPKDVNVEDPESKKRFLRKIEGQERYGLSIAKIGKEMEARLKQNQIFDIDITETFFDTPVTVLQQTYSTVEPPKTEKKEEKETEKEEEKNNEVNNEENEDILGIEKVTKEKVVIDFDEINGLNDVINSETEASIVTVLKDPLNKYGNRTASCISWLPTDGSKIAVSYCDLNFGKRTESSGENQENEEQSNFSSKHIESYVWNLQNTNKPEHVLRPESPIVCLEFNPKDSSSIIAGFYNGGVGLFDLRSKSKGTVIESSLKKGHKECVYDIRWIQSKNYTQFMSTSTDGKMCIWDLKKLNEPIKSVGGAIQVGQKKQIDPIEELILQKKKNTDIAYQGVMGGKSIHYDLNYSATKFMIGTEEGAIITGTRRKNKPVFIDKVYFGHLGPVYSVDRNPYLEKYFLTVGDWTCKIWNEELTQPIISTRFDNSYLTSGCWSPTRPNIFFSTKSDGYLDIWDLIYSQNTPLYSLHISSIGCHTVQPYGGKLLAVGSNDGNTSIVKLSNSLAGYKGNERLSNKADKDAVKTILERETKRETILITNRKEQQMMEIENQGKTKKSIKVVLEDFDEEFESIVPTKESVKTETQE